MNILFEKAALQHIDIIFSWLQEKHIQEFWDNSQNHKDDILNFIHKMPQKYFAGTTKYWVGYIDGKPYAFILSDILERNQTDLSEVHLANMSQVGHTISLDFGIGNKKYLGCGLGAPTLSAFVTFYKDEVDNKADTFFIDPDENNPRAIRVYNKAGFNKAGQYEVTEGCFIWHGSDLMVKKV